MVSFFTSKRPDKYIGEKGRWGREQKEKGKLKAHLYSNKGLPMGRKVENWYPDHNPFAMLQKWGHPKCCPHTRVGIVIFVATVEEDEMVLSFSAAWISIQLPSTKQFLTFFLSLGWEEKPLSHFVLMLFPLFRYLRLLSCRQKDTVYLQTWRQDGLRKLPIMLLNWWNIFHKVGVLIQSSQMQPQSEPPWVH